MLSMFTCVYFDRAIVTKHMIHLGSSAQYTPFFWFIMLLHLVVIISMDHAEVKTFLMFRDWWRKEADANRTINNIPETFDSMEFKVEVIKLHV